MSNTEKAGVSGTDAGVVIERVGTARSANPTLLEERSSFIGSSTLEGEFQELAARWREQTEHLSSVEVFTHPDYQRIIGMGSPVVPLLLRDLAETGAHWFWALRAITGENPVRAEDAGYVRRMAEAWLDWGRRKGRYE